IYYCDPNRSDQKGALEKNHEYIRYVLPKGTSFEKMTDKTTLLLLNHINSEKRDSLNGHSPYEVSRLLLDNRLHKALGLAKNGTASMDTVHMKYPVSCWITDFIKH
ncbi:MAG: hypothetical protein DBY24_05935, partial [Prevotellaceae bacterium]